MQYVPQSDESFEDINKLIWKHREERDWLDQAPRGLAISIALEANELLEHYQWSDKPVGDQAALAEELADIIIYAFEFAESCNIDIAASVKSKLAKAAKKYPADQFKGKKDDAKHEAWLNAKLNHKKEGL